jgi:hypothetical protein
MAMGRVPRIWREGNLFSKFMNGLVLCPHEWGHGTLRTCATDRVSYAAHPGQFIVCHRAMA